MEKIILKPLLHRGQECIGIYFPVNYKVNGALQKAKAARFSNTHKCWYTPLSKENYNKLIRALKGLAEAEQSALHEYLQQKKKTEQPALPVTVKRANETRQTETVKWVIQKPVVYKKEKISAENAHVLPAMEEMLKLKAYSQSTIKTCLGEMTQFVIALKNIPAGALKPEHLKRYLVHCYEKLGLKENTLHSRMNALKFY